MLRRSFPNFYILKLCKCNLQNLGISYLILNYSTAAAVFEEPYYEYIYVPIAILNFNSNNL